MTARSRWIASAVGGLMVLGASNATAQQPSGSSMPVAHAVSSFPPGAIEGVVEDEARRPVAGAVVTVVGTSTTLAVSDGSGRFEFQALPPGPYLIRAHLPGYTTPQAQLIQVRSTVKAGSVIGLKRVGAPVPILAAGVGLADLPGIESIALKSPDADSGPKATTAPPESADSSPGVGESETAWRIRHARRTILKDETATQLLDDDPAPPGGWTPAQLFGTSGSSPAHVVTSFIADTPFSGQVNLLTTGSFDAPQELFSPDMMPGETANVSVGAPVGMHADWTMRGAISQSDIASWMVAGSYSTRVPARNRYDVGMLYSMQRYDGGNPLALRSMPDGRRNAGELYAFDTLTIVPAVAVTYGARYSRYDYLDRRSLLSPRAEVAILPSEHLRISARASKTAHAPGAEEFLPPADSGIWLPPQRTFSSLDPSRPMRAETTNHAELDVERDLASSSIGFRVFGQRVSDQTVTVFGAEIPDQPVAKVGHYLVGNIGDAHANGCAARFSTAISGWVRGSVEYSFINGSVQPAADVRYLVFAAPSLAAPYSGRIHDVSTTVEARVPETATRVMVFYKVTSGFVRPQTDLASSAPALDSRFDVQVRQSLPFMNFTNARWEMLVAVRNFFHEASPDESVYDELLVVRPPNRIVGGLTMHF